MDLRTILGLEMTELGDWVDVSDMGRKREELSRISRFLKFNLNSEKKNTVSVIYIRTSSNYRVPHSCFRIQEPLSLAIWAAKLSKKGARHSKFKHESLSVALFMYLCGWRGVCVYTSRHIYTCLGPPPSKKIFGILFRSPSDTLGQRQLVILSSLG